jgi:hypothetical protein
MSNQWLPAAVVSCWCVTSQDFTFVLCAVGSRPLRPVEPESLREALQYLAAHRQHSADGYSAPALLLQHGMEHVLLAGEGAA